MFLFFQFWTLDLTPLAKLWGYSVFKVHTQPLYTVGDYTMQPSPLLLDCTHIVAHYVDRFYAHSQPRYKVAKTPQYHINKGTRGRGYGGTGGQGELAFRKNPANF